jgi:hypothetical protein
MPTRWQQPGAARIRHQPDLDEGLDKAGRARRQHHVAGQRQVGAGAGRGAVDRGHHRQRQCLQPADQRVEPGIDQLAQVGHVPGREIQVGQVLAGAEAAARPGQQQGARAAGLDMVERLLQRLVHRAGEAVELVGAVQGDHGHRALPMQQDRAGIDADRLASGGGHRGHWVVSCRILSRSARAAVVDGAS